MKQFLSIIIMSSFGMRSFAQNVEQNIVPIPQDSLKAIEFNAEYAEQITNRARTIYDKGIIQFEEIDAQVIGIGDKLLAADERITTALELGDISTEEAERRRKQVQLARKALKAIKPMIEGERDRLDHLNDLLEN